LGRWRLEEIAEIPKISEKEKTLELIFTTETRRHGEEPKILTADQGGFTRIKYPVADLGKFRFGFS